VAAVPLINTAVVGRPPILLGLLALLTATGTYYGLLFSLAQYFQQGLGRSVLSSGLILVPWVAAFGAAGQITRRLPGRLAPMLPAAGYLLLAGAYLAIGTVLLATRPGDVLLVALLACGGLGLGTGFATLIAHVTNAVPQRYAPDISGVSTTTLLIGGSNRRRGLREPLPRPDPRGWYETASHGFAITSLALGATALVAAGAAYLATHAWSERPAG
jgi:hypothetical protein